MRKLIESDKFLKDVYMDTVKAELFENMKRNKKRGNLVPVRTTPKIGRNEQCPCKSGKKYKYCCGR